MTDFFHWTPNAKYPQAVFAGSLGTKDLRFELILVKMSPERTVVFYISTRVIIFPIAPKLVSDF